MKGRTKLAVEAVFDRDRRARVLEVATMVTPRSQSFSNSRPSSMALVMSPTWNSSRQRSRSSVVHGFGDRGDGIGVVGLAARRLAEGGDAGVDFVHEFMEVRRGAYAR
jgi:hypothetical protein